MLITPEEAADALSVTAQQFEESVAPDLVPWVAAPLESGDFRTGTRYYSHEDLNRWIAVNQH